MQPLQAPRTDPAVSQDVNNGEDAQQKLNLYAPSRRRSHQQRSEFDLPCVT